MAETIADDWHVRSADALIPEFRLAAACCRWPPSPAREQAVAIAAAEVTDWELFLRIVRRQRVEGLVHDALRWIDVGAPRSIREALAASGTAIARQNLAFAAESARLLRRFEAAGLELLFVKGVSLSLLAYGNLAVKKAWDIDMAVPPERIREACALLRADSYVRLEPHPELSEEQFDAWVDHCKESVWRHSGTGIVVELHSALVETERLLRGVSARSAPQIVEIGGGIALPTLRTEELFAYLCVHGAGHAWSRLKWIADVAALVGKEDPAGIVRLYRIAEELGAGRSAAQALLLCERLFERALPATLHAELARDRRVRWLVAAALASMAGRNVESELDESLLGTLPIHLSHFFLGRGLRFKAAEARRKLASPHDRARQVLPRGLGFLYPLIALPSWLRRRATAKAAQRP
jgi:hypothetical protein